MQNNPILKARFSAAMQTLRAGKALDALRQFEAIIKSDPKVAEAHFQAALILMQSKRASLATQHLEQARALAPKEAAVWQASLKALGIVGDREKLEAFKKEVRRSKLPADLKKQILNRLNQPSASEWGGAPQMEVQALVQALINQDAVEAAKLATPLHKRFPDVGLITNAYATALEMNGDHDTADVLFRRAVVQAPFDVSIRMNYGRFLRNRDNHVMSLTHFQRANELRPNTLEILVSMGDAARESAQPVLALETADKALKLDPESRPALFTKSKALANLNRSDEALEISSKLIEIEPDNASFWLERGIVLEHDGDFVAAESSFLKSLELDPNRSAAYREIAAIRKFSADDPLFSHLQAEAKRDDLNDAAMSSIHFALGKMYEDTKSYETAFTHIRTANELDSSLFPFDRDNVTKRYESLRGLAERIDLPAVAANNPITDAPIFVTGMPRSGTTLTEQIVAAHSETVGVGEARWWQASLLDFWSDTFEHQLEGTALAARVQKLGEDYLTFAKAEAGAPGRTVDKSLMNQESMGLLLAAIPNARVVVLKRDPRDNLLSIYKNPFNSKVVTFNNDFNALAWTYSEFLKFIDFWSDVFPGKIYQLDYAALTADPETIGRELFEFCGLEWEDDVLEFHQKKSTVKTLSAFQVRQPIYQSSVRSWERYGNGLDPLIDALKAHGVPLPE